MRKVFLCHSSIDKEFVRRLAEALDAHAVDVWVDEKEILVGDAIREKIEAGLAASDYLAIVLSPDSVNSAWVQKELDSKLIEEIESREVTVLPILYRDCVIPAFLRGKHYADFRGDFDAGLKDLLAKFKEGDREQEVKQKVLKRLAGKEARRIDPHALAALATSAGELDGAEELILAHQASSPRCKHLPILRAAVAHQRFNQSQSPSTFIPAIKAGFEAIKIAPNDQNLKSFNTMCNNVPKSPECILPLLETLEECTSTLSKSPTIPWAGVSAGCLIIALQKLRLENLQKEKVVRASITLLETLPDQLLRGIFGAILNAVSHLAESLVEPDRTQHLKSVIRVASSKTKDAQDYSEGFLHLAWLNAILEDIESAKRWLSKYRLTVQQAAFDKNVRSHPPLDTLL